MSVAGPVELDRLTFTRFVAAFTVVVFHFAHDAFPFDVAPIQPLFFTEAVAVSYFFVLSGFIMAAVHYRPGDRVDAPAYWNARFARIYPVYALALVVPIVDAVRAHAFDGKATLLTATLVQAWVPRDALALNPPAWSLSVEAFFYLLFPSIVARAAAWSDRRLIVSASLLWAGTQALHVYLLNTRRVAYPSLTHNFLFYDPLLHLSTFVVGVAAGVLVVRRRAALAALRAHAAYAWPLAAIVAAAAVLGEGALSTALGVRVTLSNGLLAPVFAVAIVAIAIDDGAVARALAQRPLVLLGEASYALYLLQIPLYTLYERAFGVESATKTAHFYAYAALLTVVSIAVFVGVERPLRARIRGWYAGRSATGARASGPPPP